MDYTIEKHKETSHFHPVDPNWSFDDVVIPEKMRETINDIVSLFKNKDTIPKQWKPERVLGNGSLAFNFYGPPGTGKSITAEAIAHAVGKKIIRVDFSELIQKGLGDTEKVFSELFQKAVQESVILQFDEADGILGKRHTGGDVSGISLGVNQIKSHLLTLMDRVNASMVFTTNIFENYDKAFFRRILYHVPFESPGFEERKKIWQYHFVSEVPKEISYDEFSNITDTLSGGDIKNIALKLILRLQSGKIKTITECDLRNELESYKQNLNKLQTTNYILNIKNQN